MGCMQVSDRNKNTRSIAVLAVGHFASFADYAITAGFFLRGSYQFALIFLAAIALR